MSYRKPEFRVDVRMELPKAIPSFIDPLIYPLTGFRNKVVLTPFSITATCPFCETYSMLDLDRKKYISQVKMDDKQSLYIEFSIISICPSCRNTIFIKAICYLPERYSFVGITIASIIDIYPYYKDKDKDKDKDKEIEISNYIPEIFREDYYVVKKFLEISPKVAVIMSRHILENFLKYELKKGEGFHNLSNLIKEFIELQKSKDFLPSWLEKDLKHIRLNGNDAIHSNIDKKTQEVIKYEKEAAYFNLKLLDDLFDFYYVKPGERKDNYHPEV